MAKKTKKAMPKVPDDPWGAFAFFMNSCATGFARELVAAGKSETEARNSVIGCFLQMAAGEACRIARREGREPDVKKWRKATADAFKRAVQYTASTPSP
jgi:hypothetical protein